MRRDHPNGEDRFVSCGSEDERRLVTVPLDRLARDILRTIETNPTAALVYAGRLVDLLDAPPTGDVGMIASATCDFEGEVAVEFVGSFVEWSCPACGAEHRDPSGRPVVDGYGWAGDFHDAF